MLQVCEQVSQVQQNEFDLIEGEINIKLRDTSIVKLLISPNEQFLAVILSRGYNNVEEEHELFIIYDLNTAKQICLGSWTSSGALNRIIQHEFDRHSKFFIQVQQDMVSIVNLKHKGLKNMLFVGVEKFLDIDNDNYMYLSNSESVCKYSITHDTIMSYFAFGNNILSLKIIPNFSLILEELSIFYISMYLQNNQKRKKKIMLNSKNVLDFFILQNQFLVETYQETMKEIRLREIRSGKILRKSIQIEGDELIYQLVLDINEALLFFQDENYKFFKFDFLRGRLKEHLFKRERYQNSFTFGKRTIVFQNNLRLKFVRSL